MSTATTANSGTNVVITWSAPVDNYAAITSYHIKIENDSGAFVDATSHCQESDGTLLTTETCTIQLTTLRSAPFLLGYNKLVVAVVNSQNVYGQSDYSQPNVHGATVRTEPTQVLGLTYLPLLSSANTISLSWSPLVDPWATGGEAIITYNLQWD